MASIIHFGATGLVGRQVVHQALSAGHHVTAVSRNGKLPLSHDALQVITVDPADPAAVAEAIAGQDVIINTLGNRDYQQPVLVSHPLVRSVSKSIAPGQRFVTLGAISMLDHADGRLIKYHQAEPLSDYVYYPVIDHFASLELLRKSDFDWIMVCPPMILDAAPTGQVRTGLETWPEGTKLEVTAGDVARVIAAQIDNPVGSRVRLAVGGQ